MEKNLKSGELKSAIISVLKTYDRYVTSAEIVSDIEDRCLGTTEGSIHVTLKRMKDLGQIESKHIKCACCKRSLIGYKPCAQ